MFNGIAPSWNTLVRKGIIRLLEIPIPKLMRVIIAGASDTIGRKIDIGVSYNHEVVRIGTTSGGIQCDYTHADSVG